MRSSAFVAIVAGSVLSLTAWAWAQQGTTPQQPPAGSMGQGMMGGQGPQSGTSPGAGMMGQQSGTAPGGVIGAQGPQEGQGAGPGAMMGSHFGRGTMGVRRGLSLYERPLISEMLSVQQQLGLSTEQVQRLQTLRSDFEKEAIKRSADIQVAQVDLSNLLETGQPDLSKVEAQLKKIAGLQAELRFVRIKTLSQGRAVLSQEQWQKFESLAPRRGPGRSFGGPWQEGGMEGPGMMGSFGPYGGYGYR